MAYHSYAQSIPDSRPPIPLVICGDGPDRRTIEDLIKRLQLGKSVRMLGEVRGIEAVAQHLAFCKALILASTSGELWGLVVNEAMAAGCPVLVSKQCGCARDLVEDGGNGFVFDGADSDELARHLLWIHTNEDFLEIMGRRSREIIGDWSTAKFAANAAKLAMSAKRVAALGFPNSS